METTQNSYDIVVIGSGPGGYPAAIRAAQQGKKVALVEAKELGGTCLNRGCIPSKALIASAELYDRMKYANNLGIQIDGLQFDYSKMVDRKDEVVAKIRKGLEGLIKSNNITIINGFATLLTKDEIKIEGKGDSFTLRANKIIIATGSESRSIGSFPFDGNKIIDSTDLLNLRTLPKKLAIIGGGVIGCEFASLFNTFGVEVFIFEMLPRILPMEAINVSEALKKSFLKKGVKLEVNAKVETIEKNSEGITVVLGNGSKIEADMALVAVGRSLNVKDIGLESLGIELTKEGLVKVDAKMETSVPGIYAIGDIASKWWLAHVATHQGIVAADNACGKEAFMHYEAVPSVIFTQPEIATVGLSLESAKEKGYQAKYGSFPFQALGKSQATLHTDGFAQIVIDERTGQILGAQVVGYGASIMIAEMAVAIANELTVECITETIHAHPTIPEAWLEAAYLSLDQPLHMPPVK
ncbi:MAG: dihydrolipoyl dehydrogenase [Chlamydia sp. 32-24]|nr:MAG: dihydrolipoyl dehydrogenase [Chlamydia sp. 32-24]